MAAVPRSTSGRPRHREYGVALLELLVASTLMALSVVGLALLQAHARQAELDARQQARALRLLEDIQQRLQGSDRAPSAYLTPAGGLGQGDCPAAGHSSATRDLHDWCQQLQGHDVQQHDEGRWQAIGSLSGARGCIEHLSGGDYRISVAWQGLLALQAPPGSLTCGAGQYDQPARCSADRCRRVVSRRVRVQP